MCKMKCSTVCLMLWAKGRGHVLQIHGIIDSINYQEIKKSKPDSLCLESYNGPCLNLSTGHDPKTNIKNGSLSTKPSICSNQGLKWAGMVRNCVLAL